MPKRKSAKRKPLTIDTVRQEVLEARQKAGLTQGEVAHKAGLTRGPAEIGEIERDGKHIKSWLAFEKIRRVLGMK